MRQCTGMILLTIASVALSQEKRGLAVGDNVPGSFHPFNVTFRVDPSPEPMVPSARESRSTKHKYHCLITEYDMDPVVMLVARNLDESAGFRDLLTKLNTLVDNNQRGRLRAFVVALYPEELTDVVTQDEKRNEYAARLDKLAADLKLTGVVLTLAAPKDLARFNFDETVALNAIVYQKLKVTASRSIGRDALDQANGPDAQAVLASVTELMDKLYPKPKK
ncbi:MAG: hypothetical protein KGQ60_19160 [Planctomycetes bacterium]|nr:hypothetical protein [Planctomycetota bacterium]